VPIRVAIDGFEGLSRHFFAAVQAGGFSDLYDITIINEPAGSQAVASRLLRDSHYGR
jgi:D-erythrose 4-phosphate dehydrogenase